MHTLFRAILIALVVLFGAPAYAQIARDAVSDGDTTVATSLTWSHTTSGSNRYLIVTCKWTGANDLVSATYNGVSMTQIRSYVNLPSGSDDQVMFGLVAPATGANNIVVSRTGSDRLTCNGASYTGVSQTGQPEASGESAGSALSTLNVSATVVSSGAWLVMGCSAAYNGSNFSAGTATSMWDENNASGFVGIAAIFDSNGTVGTGSQTLQCLRSGSSVDIAGIVAVLAPAGGGGATPCPQMLGVWSCDAEIAFAKWYARFLSPVRSLERVQ